MKIAIGNTKHSKVKNAKHFKNNSMTNYNSDKNFYYWNNKYFKLSLK